MYRLLVSKSVQSTPLRRSLIPSKRPFSRTVRLCSPQSATNQELSETFIDGTSANYVESIYNSWVNDPSSVHVSWATFFQAVDRGAPKGAAVVSPEALLAGNIPLSVPVSAEQIELGAKVGSFLRSYRVFGHKEATLDPLGIQKRPRRPELDPSECGLTEAEMRTDISQHPNLLPYPNFLKGHSGPFTVADLQNHLRAAYCGNVGIEFMHIQDSDAIDFFIERVERYEAGRVTERGARYLPPAEMRIRQLKRLIWATSYEEFLHLKCQDKRFGCDGIEAIIPGMEALVDKAADVGVKSIVIGMAHRGRLNVLANVMKKSLSAIFHEFAAGTYTQDYMSGDVKYHLGTSCDRTTPSGKSVHLSLLANPSHLEAVNPLVEGKAYASQTVAKDKDSIMSLVVHGDASFAGQGVVYETMTMASLPRYTTQGTFHVILNNQIGFTTLPTDSRPGEYCSDVAMSVEAPIIHVNADDVDAVCWVLELAMEYRQRFHKDVVVDIVGYRRHGHNEKDNPQFTQPEMYNEVIPKHENILKLYSQRLITEGVITQAEYDAEKQAVWNTFEKEYEASKSYIPKKSEWLTSKWAGFKGPEQMALIKNTGISEKNFDTVAAALTTIPEGFTAHNTISKIVDQKRKTLKGSEPIDWATAEALAFGSLMLEGFNVRLSGQDVERGTFSHRHAVIHDQKDGATHTFLHNLPGAKGKFTVSNSFLSEYAVLGFELGYSLEDPNTLVLWEAQFGDFCNGAQIIIDQFISSGEQKWVRQSGIVLLLPHGLEGMGPEHSSARLERFLIMHDADPSTIPPMDVRQRKQIQTTNFQVVNCTTPANYFHVLRRQLHREFRKPLVLMTPKSLLRHHLAKSPRAAFDDKEHETVRFVRVYFDKSHLCPAENVKRLIFCSGKVYYDLFEEREKRKLDNVALVRIEQLAPFPFDGVQHELARFKNAEVYWCQEEAKNQGAWTYIYFNLETSLKDQLDQREIHYVGRPPSASPATGSSYQHKKELAKFMDQAFANL